MRRREARELLLRVLYQHEFVDTPLGELLAEANPGGQYQYIERVFSGIIACQEEIDKLIADHTLGWRFERLAVIDRNILRLGVFELLYIPEIPPEVAINEAIELCKKYGTDNAQLFVNGILDHLWKENQNTNKSLDALV